MNAHRWRRLAVSLVVSACGSAATSASVAEAYPLMCQAQASTTSQQAPYEISFSSLVAHGALPLRFHWDFDDGTSSDEPEPTHTFENGIYTVVLTVSDASVPEQVCRDTIPLTLGIVVDPFCGEYSSTRWGEVPLEVQLTAYPALVGDPKPYTWSWRFGDGETSSMQYPTHRYESVGTYWAVATLHTSQGSYDCYRTLRISAIAPVAGVIPYESGADPRLEPARPNPFRVMTAIGFELPRPGRVRLEILDLSGRHVATLVDDFRSAGRHFGAWQGHGESGQDVPAGMYFARLEYEGAARSTRLARVR